LAEFKEPEQVASGERDSVVAPTGYKSATMTLWEKLESSTKIISAVAIPIVIAVGGWWIQNSITKQSISKDYVTLAISVLEKPKADIDQGLRDWAVDLLNEYAPRKFPRETVARLKSGSLDLSALTAMLSSKAATNLAIAPDGFRVAIGSRDKLIRVFNLRTGQELQALRGHTDDVTSLAFTPDGKKLFSGSFDQTVMGWDTGSWKVVSKILLDSPVQGLVVAPDGRELIVGLENQTFSTYDLDSGRLVSKVRLQ
jgi:WD40 repeat protein